ncbi:3-hydroxybutyryl-CoA dehydratase-like protein, mitochondrial [Colletotrichum tanaceti]|uniref:3-hydroxybutyryl-CoA dehydratase-like protein, mitochondrial n=1 Tax=Colletotrichum tanaceti TaxID=1306861 RepID=A0A4U6X2X8_9PEZI|nr:3-hydroxybutyryl-CoA dehydratase-like protein, mitochondrial [Colletotrichum tanaceti]TKW49722.1 3-hydroxybutyryl-CoA dehydratase-like protein, mitochondrial [Colletotrichum tanaceti]
MKKLPTCRTSYAALEYDGLAISHVPSSSSAVTKVVVITLNRPHKYNAVTLEMLVGLEALFNTISEDPRVRAVVLTGEGKAFSAGADLDVGFTGMLPLKESEQTMRDFRDYQCRRCVFSSNEAVAVQVEARRMNVACSSEPLTSRDVNVWWVSGKW